MANKQELAKQANLALKQDKLIAGTNILIAQDGKTISAIGGGSTVSITPSLLTGVPIASCSIDGTPFTLYAPQGSTNYYGATDPSPSVGDNGSIYLKYNSTTGDIIAIYGKVQNVWKEVQVGGGSGLPENWICNEDYLIAYDPDAELNVLGWIPHTHTYYLDETVTNFSLGERVYNKEYPLPALGGVVGDPTQGTDRPIVLVSTEPTATYFEWNGYTNHQEISLNYLGHTWYYSGGQANYNGTPSGIAVIPDDTLSLENAAKYLIDNSDISFSTGGKFTVMSQPSSDNDVLFAGGGEESDLSDATFKVTAEGDIHGNQFYRNGVLIDRELTQAEYDNLTEEELTNGTIYFITDAESGGGGGGGGGGTPSEQQILYVASSMTESEINVDMTAYDEYIIFANDVLLSTQIPQGNSFPKATIQKAIADGTSIICYGYSNYSCLYSVAANKLTYQSGTMNRIVMIVGIKYGSGGGGTPYSETTLWSGNETPTGSGMDITLSNNISDYDLLVIYTYDPNENYGGDNFYLVNDLVIGSTYISTVYSGDSLGAYWTYTSDTSINIKRQASVYPVTYTSVKGIKFSGGGSSSETTHTYSTSEQVVGKWIDGSTVYERTIDLGTFSVGSWSDHTIESSTNMSLLIDYDGYVIESGIVYTLPDPSIRIKLTSDKSLIFTGASSWNITSGYLAIRYTKSAT